LVSSFPKQPPPDRFNLESPPLSDPELLPPDPVLKQSRASVLGGNEQGDSVGQW
jgi:hypothetical protein